MSVREWDDFMDGLCDAVKKVGEKPNAISIYFHHVTTKADYKQSVIDGTFDNKITETEYRGER